MHMLVAGLVGLVVGGGLVHVILLGHHGAHHHHHPIADPDDGEYHVHADFHIVVNGTLVNLDGDEFQTTSEQEFHKDLHLHDNNGDVLHIHRDGGTFAEFLGSIGITLTDNCLTLDNQYCGDLNNGLLLFVNDTLYTDPYTGYVPVDEDRVLLYYGNPDVDVILPYLDAVPDDACYYSGTCPERGVAPPESCGETCEL